MKLPLYILLAIVSTSTLIAIDFVPLNMKPGLWEYENPAAKMMEDMIAKMPPQVQEMMKSKMQQHKPIQSCLTTAAIQSPEHYIQKMNEGNCTFNLKKSTPALMDGNMVCTSKGYKSSIDITIEVLNDKKVINKSNINTTGMPGGANTKVAAAGVWLSDVCPPSLKK